MKPFRPMLIVAALALAGIGAAFAESGGQPADAQREAWKSNPKVVAMRQACAADMERLCPNLRGPDRRACMQTHAAELSMPCADARTALREEMKAKGMSPAAPVQN